MDSYEFIKQIDQYDVAKAPRTPKGIYPSQAYLCPLHDYYQMLNIKGISVIIPRESQHRMDEGEILHDALLGRWKMLGDESDDFDVEIEVPFVDDVFHISGRVDGIIFNNRDKEVVFLELKIVDKLPGKPYERAERQLATYMGRYEVILKPKYKDYRIIPGVLVYHSHKGREYFKVDGLPIWKKQLEPYLLNILDHIGRKKKPKPIKYYAYSQWCTEVCEYRHLCPLARGGDYGKNSKNRR